MRRRLDALVPSEHVVLSGSLTSGRDPKLARWSRLLPKSVKDMSRIERRLASAGQHSAVVAVCVAVAEILLPVLAAAAALAWFGLKNPTGWIAAAIGAAFGYLLPGLYIDLKIAARRKQIRNGLPDVLDLLIICLEAGSSLDQAVVKASEELAIAYPALAEELRLVTTETRAGKPRLEAFKNLAQRTRVEDIRALVAMLVQTDRFGTSVAQALRAMADEMRTKRRQAAEEAAAKVGVKLVFPLVFCLFPALYVVMLGPAVLQFMRTFPD
jgi:tight adherence protein C